MARTVQPVSLTDTDIRFWTTLTKRGATSTRVQTRARILLLLHRGRPSDEVAATLQVGLVTVFNIKRRYLTEGLAVALHDKLREGTGNHWSSSAGPLLQNGDGVRLQILVPQRVNRTLTQTRDVRHVSNATTFGNQQDRLEATKQTRLACLGQSAS